MYKHIIQWFDSKRRPHKNHKLKEACPKQFRHELLEDRRMLATLTVTVGFDIAIDPLDGDLTLRDAIAYVNGTATPGPADLNHIVGVPGQSADTILFADELFTNDEATIKLTQVYDSTSSDPSGLKIAVQNSLIITAGAERRVTITMGQYEDAPPVAGRVLDITGTAEEITLENLTFTGGSAGPSPFKALTTSLAVAVACVPWEEPSI